MDFKNDLNSYSDNPNPTRGCGKKKHDAFYGEGGGFYSNGALNVWTWLLGDGIDNNVALEIPARQVQASSGSTAFLPLFQVIGPMWCLQRPLKMIIPVPFQVTFPTVSRNRRQSCCFL